ncbi:hypothetical protein ECE50_028345 [Chitinophaga sp. Mgbs1]|uniref:Uncharacterized protein n=1 Tax=Chitinophaga solisilvae TaxID=1233460 RepID=A0A433WKE5_9BACT|nr:hypothetical protein [Chitinophaga solisilvae]
MNKKAIIIGAGPAGLITAYTLLQRTDIIPVILEESGSTGNASGMGVQHESYIYYNNRLFANPVHLNMDTLRHLGVGAGLRLVPSYIKAQLFPRRKEKTLEDAMVNRYGKALYEAFYKDYTEKLCGLTCREIPASWGIPPMNNATTGHNLTHQVEVMGGKILKYHGIQEISVKDDNITSITAFNHVTEEAVHMEGDYFISTIPAQDLVNNLNGYTPPEIKETAAGLKYRNVITASILLKKLSFLNKSTGEWKPFEVKDCAIYIAGKDIKAARIQVNTPVQGAVWVNMEYYCSHGDALWRLSDEEIQQLAIAELDKSGLSCSTNVLDTAVTRTEKALAVYSTQYEQFGAVREFFDRFKNLFLVGGNAMHKNNDITYATATASTTVENINSGVAEKENIWATPLSGSKVVREEKTLADYVFRNPKNRWYVIASVLAMVVQFGVFKYIYPFAGFINGDSYAYLETAIHNMDINTYPIGYSKFLRLLSVFTHYDTALIAIQYFFVQISVLGFVFTLFKFFEPIKGIKIAMLVFVLANPALLYISNYVSSDALFLGLSLTWLTLLLWIIYRPTTKVLLWHCIVLFLAFTVRYNALWYPALSAFALLLSAASWKKKIWTFGLSVLLIGWFIQFNVNAYKEKTGTKQFTPFTGWQMANNAMYTYRYIDSAARKPVPAKFRKLDNMIREYFDSTRDTKKFPSEAAVASTYYMWSPGMPLQDYMALQFKKDSTTDILTRWAKVAPLYQEYGSYIIRQYPVAFLRHYMWPNFIKYYTPPTEFLAAYNMGDKQIGIDGQKWFHYKSGNVFTRVKTFRVTILEIYPILSGTMNVIYFFGMICILILGVHKQGKLLTKVFSLSFLLWITNMAFSVFASPIALRFQYFPFLVTSAFAIFILGLLYVAATKKETI